MKYIKTQEKFFKNKKNKINHKFQIGDLVCCINDSMVEKIKKGKIYSVFSNEFDDDDLYIQLEEFKDDKYHNYHVSRFRLATPEEAEEFIMNKNISKYSL